VKRFLWQIKKKLLSWEDLCRRWFIGLTFHATPERLKQAVYYELPFPIHWQNIAQGRKLIVEIGSGHGEVLVYNKRDESIAVGFETKTRFFKLSKRKIRNRSDVYIYQADAYQASQLLFEKKSIDTLLILFPDPWHKKKHNKRRPITANYLRKITQNLKNTGTILIASDWPDYVLFIDNELKKVTDIYTIEKVPYTPEKFGLPSTHYYQKWQRKGRSFTAFVLKKR
jgi:tRNA (guanine-N7-)-methyltransferase